MFKNLLTATLGIVVLSAPAFAQVQLPSGIGATGAATGRDQGLSQTGEVTSSAALNRPENGFIGAVPFQPRSESTSSSGLGNSFNSSGVSGFGGSSLGGQGGFGTGLGGFGTGFGGGLGGFGNTLGFSNRNSNQAGQTGIGNTATTPLRFPMRPAFDRPPLVATETSLRFQRRIERIPGFESAASIAVKMSGRTAVLNGRVSSDRLKTLAGRLALFEPGIDQVQNNLVVSAEPQKPEELPTPSLIDPAGR